MKRFFFCVLFLAAGIASSSANAAFTIDETHVATKMAATDFVAKNAAHAPHFVGYKSWKSGEEAKVKIYVTHEGMNMEFNYVCHKHDAIIECHEQ